MEVNNKGTARAQQYLEGLGRRTLQNNPSYMSTNLKDTPSMDDFAATGQKVLDSLDLRGKDGAMELRQQINSARQFAIQNGKLPR